MTAWNTRWAFRAPDRLVSNSFLDSDDISTSNWSKSAGGTGVTPVVTKNFGIAPDGSQTAHRVQLNQGIGGTLSDISMVRQLFSTTAPSGKVWIKLNSGTLAWASIFDRANCPINNTWFPWSVQNASDIGDARILALQGSLGHASSGDFLVWHPQIESASGKDFIGYSEYVSSGQSLYFPLSYTRISCWGDSLSTQYMPQILRYKFQQDGSDAWVYEGGVGGQTSIQIKARMLAHPERWNDTTTIWAGRNNFTDPTTVKADIAAMVAALGHSRFVVLGIINMNRSDEWITGNNYPIITQLNADLAATYPDNFIDIRSYLISQYNPGDPTDVTDHGNDVVPTSLHLVYQDASVDALHLNFTGYGLVAQKIKDFIQTRWNTAPVGTFWNAVQ